MSFTDSIFKTIIDDKYNNLIIDLRGNTGGWTANGKHLFSYFIDHPMKYIRKVEIKKYESFSFDSLIVSPPGYLDTFKLEMNNSNVYEWTNYPSLKVKPQSKTYSGNVFIVVDELSKSCSAVFSTLIQNHTNAILLGNETGASRCGTSGIVMAVQLPYTKVPIHFSTARYYLNIPENANCSGVVPHYNLPHHIMKNTNNNRENTYNFAKHILGYK